MSQASRFKKQLENWTVEQAAAEYNLICKKESKLSETKQRMVIYVVHEMIKQGTLSYKQSKPVKNLNTAKTAGIVTDNFKLKKFKEKLREKGFTDFKIFDFTKDTYTIKVKYYSKHQLKMISNICTEVELYFKQSN